MTTDAFLSAKMPLVSQRGFTLRHNCQPRYESAWHRHDCAMLLWPQTGALQSSWSPEAQGPRPAATISLTRGSAIFLPPDTAHRTAACTARQQHGELYLAPELLRGFRRQGAMRLDGATTAMLDALLAPTLQPQGAEHLVRAVLAQCAAARWLPLAPLRRSLVSRMIERFDAALEREDVLPSVLDVACELGVSMRTLQRQCEAEVAATPAAIRRRLLASRARLLLRGGQTLAQVSRRMDFANSGHLTRLLKSVSE
jgi:AraC-like DNA-binding protein